MQKIGSNEGLKNNLNGLLIFRLASKIYVYNFSKSINPTYIRQVGLIGGGLRYGWIYSSCTSV